MPALTLTVMSRAHLRAPWENADADPRAWMGLEALRL